MKLMIASDIHGSAHWCERLLSAWDAEGRPRLLLLGDLLYHGPRNDLPDGYAPKRVIELLNGIRNHLLCVRGNCEAEVDQMVLTFPVMAEYCVLPCANGIIYATHGHIHSEQNPPPHLPGDILLCGHTHIPAYAQHETFIYVNPGSVSIPKASSPHSYIMLEGTQLTWKSLPDGAPYRREQI